MYRSYRVYLCTIFLLVLFSANAQEYRRFRAGIGFSYLQKGVNGGAAANVEISYRLKDNILVGYRGEIAAANDKVVGSKSLNTQYYFNGRGSFRPFIGIGAGLFRPRMSMSGGCGGPGMDHASGIETKLGFYPRVGFDLHHLFVTLDWNIAPSSKSTVSNGLQPTDVGYDPPHTVYMNNNYLALKVGIFFGGGRKKIKHVEDTAH